MKNDIIINFEKHTGLGPTYACELLGVAYSTYNQVRCGSRTLQVYLRRHIEAVQLLPPATLEQLIKEHCRNGRKD